MTPSSRTLLTAAFVTLCGAAVASAQVPTLPPVVVPRTVPQTQYPPGVQRVPTVSPVPVIVQQQQQAWATAYNNALLWQMYQPPVIYTTGPFGPVGPVPYPYPPVTIRCTRFSVPAACYYYLHGPYGPQLVHVGPWTPNPHWVLGPSTVLPR